MKTLNMKHDIALEGISKVEISNELLGTCIVQSEDEAIHIQVNLSIDQMDGEHSISIEDFIEVNTDETNGEVTINIQDFNLDEADVEISQRSTVTIAIPVGVAVSAETDNYYIAIKQMQNSFELNSENGSIMLEDCAGDLDVHNENGSIKLVNTTGNIKIEQENGSISTDNLSGDELSIQSENGSVKMRGNQFIRATISSENGNVFFECLPVASGSIEISNENGNIQLVLSPTQGFKLEASTEMGQIKNTFLGSSHYATGEYSFSFGDEMLNIELKTENGGIKITSGDMASGDYLKGKFDAIKDLLRDNSDEGINEARKLITQLIASLTKIMEGATEDNVKEKIKSALDYLNSWKDKLNDPEVRGKVKDSIDGVSQEINKTVQETVKVAQEALKLAQEKFKSELKPQYDKQFAKAKEFWKGFKQGHPFPPMPPMPPFAPHPTHPSNEKEVMQEKARMKILEMLEAGKITAEEAERLLNAIH